MIRSERANPTCSSDKPSRTSGFEHRRQLVAHVRIRARRRPFDRSNASRYHTAVIKSFRDAETEQVWEERVSLRLPRAIQSRALMKLQQLNAAGDLRDLRIPAGNQLEKLTGDRAGQWSIRINEQWRICFDWTAGHAEHVEICDYH